MQKVIFGVILVIALIGLALNFVAILFSIFKTIINLAVIIGVIYLIYFFFFLTPDQREYKKRVWKNKMKRYR
ncbi:SA1362 family protein [Staphylococcus lutrae]|uniref:SA1362 family protein n=1 Tax=Staphylococcus lutrae TaxID=155085 RepID=UPI001F0C523E|nr:SA1362 family protein [Staphylococcus lutrae]